MRVLTIHGVDDLRLDEVAVPAPGSRDVVVRVRACGVCGSDLGFVRRGGPRPGQGPAPIGHEFAGEIAAVGLEVRNAYVGQRVVINPMSTPGPLGNGGPEGAFAESVLIRDAGIGHNVLPIPDDLAWDVAALVEPLAVSLHGVNRAGAKPGDRVVVFGCGPIGLGVVLWLTDRGVSEIVAVDRSVERLERARALGAAVTIDASQGDVAERIVAAHGADAVYSRTVAGSDIFIDAAGGGGVLTDIVALAKRHARIVVLAAYPGEVPVNLSHLLSAELTLTAALAYPTEMPEVIAALPRLRAEAASLISHRFALDDAIEAFAVAASPQSAKVLIEFQ